MAIQDFNGKTFVAFADIAGFKSMMKDKQRGPESLDALYSSGYRAIKDQELDTPHVEGLFVSDCGVLFVRDGCDELAKLESLLTVIEQLNKFCFERAVLLTTSVAWGDFSYRQRIEIQGIEKAPVCGDAYVEAFRDNESDESKLYPTECRVVKDHLPPKVAEMLGSRVGRIGSRSREAEKHYYFEWMRPCNLAGDSSK